MKSNFGRYRPLLSAHRDLRFIVAIDGQKRPHPKKIAMGSSSSPDYSPGIPRLSDFSPQPGGYPVAKRGASNATLTFPDNLDVGTGRDQVIAADHQCAGHFESLRG
jgi:hypothetical protein